MEERDGHLWGSGIQAPAWLPPLGSKVARARVRAQPFLAAAAGKPADPQERWVASPRQLGTDPFAAQLSGFSTQPGEILPATCSRTHVPFSLVTLASNAYPLCEPSGHRGKDVASWSPTAPRTR